MAAGHEKSAQNFKKPKDGVSILAAANASGDFRLPLLLIRKSQNPQCLKHVNQSALPVVYACQKKRGWIQQYLNLGSHSQG